jgi:homoserine kinase
MAVEQDRSDKLKLRWKNAPKNSDIKCHEIDRAYSGMNTNVIFVSSRGPVRTGFYSLQPLSMIHRMETCRVEAVARAFCSTANLGAGFDTFGLALDRYSDIVAVRLTQNSRIKITIKGPLALGLPSEVDRNSAGPPAVALLQMAHSKKGLAITIDKDIPPGAGLGSSGATAAASTKAIDRLLSLGLSSDELLRVASLGEKAVSGAAHADNVGASLLGGFVVVYGKPVRAISFTTPSTLRLVVATPEVPTGENKTRKARKLVPRKIETDKAVLNVGRASAIVAGFARHDISMIGSGMIDEIAEPYRRSTIPGYDDVKRLALEAGAAGVAISGAGPSLIGVVDKTEHNPQAVARAMVRGFSLNKTRAKWFVARPASGASIIRSR